MAAASSAPGGGEASRCSYADVVGDPSRFAHFTAMGGDTHPLYQLLKAQVEGGDNGALCAAIDASPMPSLIKHIFYKMVDPKDAGWGWSEKNMKTHPVELVKAAQLILQPLALLEFGLEHGFDEELIRMCFDHAEDHLPGTKALVLGSYWQAAGSPEGDADWAWNHLKPDDGEREMLSSVIHAVCGDDLFKSYDVARDTARTTFAGLSKLPKRSAFLGNGCAQEQPASPIPPCDAFHMNTPFLYGHYRVTPGDGWNELIPSGSCEVALRMPDKDRKDMPRSIRHELARQGVACVQLFLTTHGMQSVASRVGGAEVNFFSHPLIHNKARDASYDKKTEVLTGLYEGEGVVPWESDEGPMPFDTLEPREVHAHGGAMSPKNLMFGFADGSATFWTVQVVTKGSGVTERRIAYVAQHYLVAPHIPGVPPETVAELADSVFAPQFLREHYGKKEGT